MQGPAPSCVCPQGRGGEKMKFRREGRRAGWRGWPPIQCPPAGGALPVLLSPSSGGGVRSRHCWAAQLLRRLQKQWYTSSHVIKLHKSGESSKYLLFLETN